MIKAIWQILFSVSVQLIFYSAVTAGQVLRTFHEKWSQFITGCSRTRFPLLNQVSRTLYRI